MTITVEERQRRADVVARVLVTAVVGANQRFLQHLPQLDWPGGWLTLFKEIALLPPDAIPDRTRHAFADAWCGWGRGVPPMIRDSAIIRDLDGHQHIMCAALRMLMPPVSHDQMPTVIFRGQTLDEHERGEHGVWWTHVPKIAEWFARSSLRPARGPRVVLAAFDPGPAIIVGRGREILVDPSLLDHVEIMAVPLPYSEQDESNLDLDATSILDRVPHGLAFEAVKEWKLRAGISLTRSTESRPTIH